MKQGVDRITLKHWLVAPLVPRVGEEPFYFCDSKDCEVVYFSEDHSAIYYKHQVRERIGFKEVSGEAKICYCFGISREMISEEIIRRGKSDFFSWIKEEIRQGFCACEIRNPSGRCCLKQIKDVESELQALK